MSSSDDDLVIFDEQGAILPETMTSAVVEHDGARLWYACLGTGPTVILSHGGMGNSGNFAHQIQPLVEAGYRVVAIDSRGHGRSSRDTRPYSYQLLASDILAVMDDLGLQQAALLGWSDGACSSLILADQHPDRVIGVLFFACNMDHSGTLDFVMRPVIGHCLARHIKDYQALSPTPDQFDTMSADVNAMQSSQPNYSAAQLAGITVPVTILQAEHDEFIRPEHAAYLAATIPGARLVTMENVSHFAPLQRPEIFNAAILAWLSQLFES